MENKNTRRGFTLIELLVVVLIIGILAAIAVPQYQKAVIKSRYATIKNLVSSLVQAQEVYYLANNNYADDFEKLDIAMPDGKLENSTKSAYFYPWGECGINSNQVVCKNNSINMTYQQFYLHNSTGPGRVCGVEETQDLTDIRNSVCKSETGAEKGKVSSTFNAISWTYQ